MSRLSKLMLEVSPYKELEFKYKQLEQQLQQAHREGKAEGIRLGWEQAKAEAVAKADELFKYESGYYHYREDVGDAIASMEYRDKGL